MKWAAATLLVLLGAPGEPGARAQQGENRHWTARFALEGPLEELRLGAGPAGVWGTSVLDLELLPGERRELVLPLAWRSPLGTRALPMEPELAPVARPEGAGGGRFLGWTATQPADALDALPPGLAARPRPPLAPGLPGLGAPGFLLALVALVLGAGLARRPRASAGAAPGGAGAGAAPGEGPRDLAREPGAASPAGTAAALLLAAGVGLLLFLLGRRAPPPAPPVEVLEGDLARGAWLQVRSAAGELAGPFARLEVDPAGARIDFLVRPSGEPLARAEGPSGGRAARLHALLPLEGPRAAPGGGLAEPPFGTLEEAWARTPGGRWRRLGTWRAGEPAPSVRAGGEPEEPGDRPAAAALPGWLVTGLPPGSGVLVGRLAGEARRWVRVTGVGGGGPWREND